MTAPATEPGDDELTIRSGGHEGVVYVHNPLSGEVEGVAPDEAATRVYNRGWAPVSKEDAQRVDAHELLRKAVTPGEAVTTGLVRGLSGGLSDLAPMSDEDRRLTQSIDEEHPWLTGGAEAAGFLSPLGVGAGLGAIGEGVTSGLRGGAELGVLGNAATRAAGMGVEGAAYGGIGAARESAIEDTPLTAQKLLSGMFGGAIVAGGLGAGVGALEGSGSLLRGMFKNSSAAREELNVPGLKDSDISPILERAGVGPLEPGALQKLQSLLYNDPNITPEFLAAMGKSKGIRDDVMFAAGPQRAEAEALFAKALNDLHGGNQDALAGWAGRLKRDKIASWIGPETEHVSDAGTIAGMLKMMDVQGRFNLSQDIVEAVERAGAANPKAFAELMNSVSATSKEEALRNIDRALLHGDQDVLDQLVNSRLLNDENIAEVRQKFGGLSSTDKTLSYDDAEAAMRPKAKGLSDYEQTVSQAAMDRKAGDIGEMGEYVPPPAPPEGSPQEVLRKLLRVPERAAPELEPMWKSQALDYIDRQLEVLGELEAQPRGYVAGKGGGQIKKLGELMKGARQSIEEGDRANAFGELDYVKKRVASVRGSGRIATGEGVRGVAQVMHEEARQLLEDSGIWGARAANAQKEMNAILHARFTRDGDFYNSFYSGAGMPDPKNPWEELKVADPAKIRGVMDRLVNPDHSLELQQFKKHIAESDQLADIMEKYYSPDAAGKAVIQSMRDGTKVANDAMDKALHYALRENQGKILGAAAHGGARGVASSVAAYALGGPLGLAGAVVGKALMNPGRMWRMQAIVERMLGSHGGRVAEGLASVVDKATRVAGTAAQKSTRVLGSAAMLTQDVESRQAAYHDTLHDLAAMASNADMVIKTISSWHGPDLAHMPNAIPEMAAAIQRGAQFCLKVAPARPQPGMFSDDSLGLLSDSEAEEFSHTVHAAMDPTSIFGFIRDGRLTPQILQAAETTAPDLVDDMREQTVQMFATTAGNVKVGPVQQVGLAMLLGVTPSPAYVSAIQMSWKDSAQPNQKLSVGNMGDTGVNERYSKSTFSAADRLESGEHSL